MKISVFFLLFIGVILISTGVIECGRGSNSREAEVCPPKGTVTDCRKHCTRQGFSKSYCTGPTCRCL